MNPPEIGCHLMFLRILPTPLWAALVLAACAPAVPDAPVDVGAYPGIIRLACVGDSLTANEDGWPVHLDRMLDARWDVRNFGQGGATALATGDHPYATLKLAEVLAYQPDVVVILLGTNDSKPRHWHYQKEFERDYGQMIEDLRALPSRPRIWVCLPPPAFPGQWGIDEDRIQEMLPVLRRMAQRRGVPVIDLHSPLMDWGDHFPDQVHPDARASAEMARHIHRALIGREAAP